MDRETLATLEMSQTLMSAISFSHTVQNHSLLQHDPLEEHEEQGIAT